MSKIAVIGLGRFGMALAKELQAGGAHVIAIDRTSNLVTEIKDEVDLAVRLDSTDEIALRAQEVDRVDVAVVSIGENFEAALLTTVLLKKMGVPQIICRAQTQFHAEIFSQIGANEVIQPEIQAGRHLGKRLANEHIGDYINLAEGYTLIELKTPRAFAGKTLKQLALRSTYSVNLVGIKRHKAVEANGEIQEQVQVLSVLHPDDVIQADDLLVLIGSDEALSKLPRE